MADLLKRLFGPINIAAGTSTLFTGTAAHTYTIKNINIVNNTAGPITLKMGIGGVTDALLIMPATVIGAGETLSFEGMLVLSGTETLQANASATGLTITASGLDQN